MQNSSVRQPIQSTIFADDERKYLEAGCLDYGEFNANQSDNQANDKPIRSALLDEPVLLIDLDNSPKFQSGKYCYNDHKFRIEINDEEKQDEFGLKILLKKSIEFKVNNKLFTIDVNNLTSGQNLGVGKYGFVQKVNIEQNGGIDIAVKRIQLRTEPEYAAVIHTELKMAKEILNSNRYPYLLDYYGLIIDTDNSELCICMQLMDSTMKSFYETMYLYNEIMPNNLDLFISRLIHNVITALEFLAKKNYFHRDIKPENILINNHGVFKLSDYGICCSKDDINSNKYRLMGTIHYLSPEILETPPYICSVQSELWALGITLIEIVNGQHPYISSNSLDQCIKINNYNPTISNKIISKEIEDFILSLLKRNVQDRPISYDEILNMLFIKRIPNEPTINELNFIKSVIEIIQELAIEVKE
ncbi:unnamed protein product [Rotaria sordida]|uniref:mitogen-activated protein kinase kinase n=1 Tax=Rotaria sordida TaxID=392033 RepID=A0A819RDE0_9BILA|nr:unnamed protein product [Rotaria sordida]CAF1338822.1 unnamed protein product [Rotaria sordida]CAF3768312.1 unnamed protein product [Rotaria sordida]CAF4044318.1 unnamed protein product [Rotaria sordida]